MTIDFQVDPKETKMYEWLGDEAYFLEDHAYSFNSHSHSVSPTYFESDENLKELYTLTAVSYLDDGTPFGASFEGKDYPIFATQFHPEKTSHIYYEGKGINHEWMSVQLNRHFADYFVYLARHNTNSFGDFAETSKYLVQNYDQIVTEGYDSTVYVFKNPPKPTQFDLVQE